MPVVSFIVMLSLSDTFVVLENNYKTIASTVFYDLYHASHSFCELGQRSHGIGRSSEAVCGVPITCFYCHFVFEPLPDTLVVLKISYERSHPPCFMTCIMQAIHFMS